MNQSGYDISYFIDHLLVWFKHGLHNDKYVIVIYAYLLDMSDNNMICINDSESKVDNHYLIKYQEKQHNRPLVKQMIHNVQSYSFDFKFSPAKQDLSLRVFFLLLFLHLQFQSRLKNNCSGGLKVIEFWFCYITTGFIILIYNFFFLYILRFTLNIY